MRFDSYTGTYALMSKKNPTLDILISTIDDGILKVPAMLLPERADVRYIVSVQHTIPQSLINVPAPLAYRQDVKIVFLEGKGLSRNRNNALRTSDADICLIADDDNLYTPQCIDTILEAWRQNPDADIITFQAETYQGEPLHPYPAPYICSQEITLRRESVLSRNVLFDERFGLGSQLLCAGEEDVFIHDARKAGLNVKYVPQVIVRTDKFTTGSKFLTDRCMQITKGAAFRHLFGVPGAVWRSFKEAGWYLFHKRSNPFPILFNMLKGIWILR